MSVDLNYYRAIQGSLGLNSELETQRMEAKIRLYDQIQEAFPFEEDTTRNGEPQKLLVTKTDNVRKMNVHALPGEELCLGDVIYCYDHYWIVTDMYATDIIEHRGIMRQCNINLRFQVGTSEIYERPAVLDSGVYSTTLQTTDAADIPNQQYKLYMHRDEQTERIGRDKRIATEQWYDNDGNRILNVFRITAFESAGVSYGDRGLIIFRMRGDQYSPTTDNLDEMICDYIDDSDAVSYVDEKLNPERRYW